MKKSLLFGLLIFIIGVFVYYMAFHFMVLDEGKILRASQDAFEEEPFNEWVFNNEKELTGLVKFLLSNSEIIAKGNNKTISTIGLQQDGTKVNNKNVREKPCAYIIDPQKLINSNIPKSIQDSIHHYILSLDSKMIKDIIL